MTLCIIHWLARKPLSAPQLLFFMFSAFCPRVFDSKGCSAARLSSNRADCTDPSSITRCEGATRLLRFAGRCKPTLSSWAGKSDLDEGKRSPSSGPSCVLRWMPNVVMGGRSRRRPAAFGRSRVRAGPRPDPYRSGGPSSARPPTRQSTSHRTPATRQILSRHFAVHSGSELSPGERPFNLTQEPQYTPTRCCRAR